MNKATTYILCLLIGVLSGCSTGPTVKGFKNVSSDHNKHERHIASKSGTAFFGYGVSYMNNTSYRCDWDGIRNASNVAVQNAMSHCSAKFANCQVTSMPAIQVNGGDLCPRTSELGLGGLELDGCDSPITSRHAFGCLLEATVIGQ
jgi:hypothetical protein